MKRYNFNKLLTLFGVLFVLSLSSCIKDFRPNETNLNNLKPTVNIVEGGLYQFSMQALLFPSTDAMDTATFHVNYAAVNVTPTDEVFSIAISPSAITNYNTSGGGLKYEILPDSCYSFTATSATVAKGQTYSDPISVIFYPSKINPSFNYMLPISITQAPAGVTISSNVGTIYYHFIGNPLAGGYTWDFTRYNGDTTTAQNSSSFTGHSVNVGPVDPNNLIFPDSYLQTFVASTAGVKLTFDNNGGVLSNFTVSFDDATMSGLSSGGFSIATAPVLLSANIVGNAATNYSGSSFRTYFSLVNSSGGTRTLVDNFVKK
ncbi:MAG: DUF1735 domain-containing protein [Ginsengibacter sp.]